MGAKDPRPRLHDILEAIEGVQAAVGPLTFEAYCGSWVTRRAAERAVEIISEASRHLPDVLKAQEPDVPWRDIAGIGNVLRHEYHRLDDAVIYTIVTRQLGPLESAVRRLLQRLDETGAAS